MIAALLVLGACGREADGDAVIAPVVDASSVAATVEGEPIYVSDVQLEAESQGVVEEGEPLEPDSADFHRILDELIDVKLLAQEAESRGLDEDPKTQHRLESAREHILGNVLVEAIVAERVDEAAIRKMYEEQVAIWELGEEARISHIQATTRSEMEAIAAELAAGADFAVLASQKSTDAVTRLEGGNLGFMTEQEASPEFARAIEQTPTGGVSKPFDTSAGWHVIKVNERRKEQPPAMDKLRDPILQYLTLLQIDEVLKELRADTRIERKGGPRDAPLDTDPFTIAPTERNKPPPQFDASTARAPDPDATAADRQKRAAPAPQVPPRALSESPGEPRAAEPAAP